MKTITDKLQKKLQEIEMKSPSSSLANRNYFQRRIDNLSYKTQDREVIQIPQETRYNPETNSKEEFKERKKILIEDISNYHFKMFPLEMESFYMSRDTDKNIIMDEINNIFQNGNKRKDGKKQYYEDLIKYYNERIEGIDGLDEKSELDLKIAERFKDIYLLDWKLQSYDEYYTNYEALKDKLKKMGKGEDIYLLEKVKEYLSITSSNLQH